MTRPVMSEEELEALERSLELSIQSDDGDVQFEPTELERQHKFREVLKNIMPYLGTDEKKIILAEIMIALKLEGMIGKQLSDRDSKLVQVLKEAIMKVPERKRQALRYAYDLLR